VAVELKELIMFKYESVVEEVKAEVSAPSFQVIDLANANGLVNPEAQQHWVDACTWGTSCGGCSATGTCTGGSSCVGCSNSFNNPGYGSAEEPITEKDLLKAIMG
jgi:hypothetical protein